MVFGEPDLELRTPYDAKLQEELRGPDVYDPTSGEIPSSSTDDIASWFMDIDYNEETFFVRHAYFTSGDEPYKKLQRALKAEIDEEAWASLYSTVSSSQTPCLGLWRVPPRYVGRQAHGTRSACEAT
jgi:adenine-specific DNA-methyltransferase